MSHGDLNADREQNELARYAEANRLRREAPSTVPVSHLVILTYVSSWSTCHPDDSQDLCLATHVASHVRTMAEILPNGRMTTGNCQDDNGELSGW